MTSKEFKRKNFIVLLSKSLKIPILLLVDNHQDCPGAAHSSAIFIYVLFFCIYIVNCFSCKAFI